MKWLIAATAMVTASCNSDRAGTATLYRNSSIDAGVRVQFASFDASESDPAFNINNCRMTARVLNANVERLNGGPMPVGFWCEDGGYRANGSVPAKFEAKFPVD